MKSDMENVIGIKYKALIFFGPEPGFHNRYFHIQANVIRVFKFSLGERLVASNFREEIYKDSELTEFL